jgi:hypothetical protein
MYNRPLMKFYLVKNTTKNTLPSKIQMENIELIKSSK